ncbi:sulfotransferase family 2 domain-containing protein [Neptunomonas phycophila]|uniref:sulfotransferase family 2 domain-containing protein n=1 Tax=Neptunomonas phycophila TaxID=1572645 RepID=UPI0015C11675|nr:sulfotransferase family 2 domain-containing protein [Neptunomonas phycophila]
MIYSLRRKLKGFSGVKNFYLWALRLLPVHTRYEINRKLRSPYSTLEDDKKIIYIHIPKAAGNALIKSLYGVSATGHDLLSRYKDNNESKFNLYYKFAVVRNPFDRFVSSFFYLKQGGIGFFDDDFAKKYLSGIETFEEFVLKINSDKKFEAAVMSWIHFVPQIDFLSLDGSTIGVDRVVKLEQINDSLSDLCTDLKIPLVEMKRDNASKRAAYKEYYTPELKEVVGRLYEKDLNVLQYSFEG